MENMNNDISLEATLQKESVAELRTQSRIVGNTFSMTETEDKVNQLRMTPYQAYLKAKVKIREMTPKSLKLGIELLKQVIAIKPGFVLPYLELHQAYLSLFELGMISKSDALAKGEGYLRVALELDPNQAECLLQVARVYSLKKDGAAKAYTYFERAMALQPLNAEYYQEFAVVLLKEKNTGEALKVIDQAIGLDSISAKSYFLKSLTLYFLGKFGEARMELDKCLLLKPSYIYAQLLSIRISYAEGKVREVVNSLLALYYSDNSDYEKQLIRTWIVALQGDYDKARINVQKLEEASIAKSKGWMNFLFIQIYLEIGEYQHAENIYENRMSDEVSSIVLLLEDAIFEELKIKREQKKDEIAESVKVNQSDRNVEQKGKSNFIAEGMMNVLQAYQFLYNKWAIKR